MPNHCKNRLRLYGHPEDVKSAQKSIEQRVETGTFKNFDPDETVEWEPGIIFRYKTAWKPNGDVMNELSREHPAVYFIHDYHEDTGGFRGRCVLRSNEALKDDYFEYNPLEEMMEDDELTEEELFQRNNKPPLHWATDQSDLTDIIPGLTPTTPW